MFLPTFSSLCCDISALAWAESRTAHADLLDDNFSFYVCMWAERNDKDHLLFRIMVLYVCLRPKWEITFSRSKSHKNTFWFNGVKWMRGFERKYYSYVNMTHLWRYTLITLFTTNKQWHWCMRIAWWREWDAFATLQTWNYVIYQVETNLACH